MTELVASDFSNFVMLTVVGQPWTPALRENKAATVHRSAADDDVTAFEYHPSCGWKHLPADLTKPIRLALYEPAFEDISPGHGVADTWREPRNGSSFDLWPWPPGGASGVVHRHAQGLRCSEEGCTARTCVVAVVNVVSRPLSV
ncbi:hypothetical protein [Amycolatopsis vastitatis]|uniref:hypothetical protein n=1 Tax=Amycolatopsis vastitatis TaxID=1905142 RepID=UPI00196A711F|nr:hypothetical protein [Amycolatopsis vastitatis]